MYICIKSTTWHIFPLDSIIRHVVSMSWVQCPALHEAKAWVGLVDMLKTPNVQWYQDSISNELTRFNRGEKPMVFEPYILKPWWNHGETILFFRLKSWRNHPSAPRWRTADQRVVMCWHPAAQLGENSWRGDYGGAMIVHGVLVLVNGI